MNLPTVSAFEKAPPEQTVFRYAKEVALKEILDDHTNSRIEFYKAARWFLR
jgi:hypothetical protein